MKKIYTLFLFFLSFVCLTSNGFSQSLTDTLAIQDFELTPATPTWTFTGPVIYNSGFSTASAAPPNSPIGINGSRAWETTTNSSGLVLQFANTAIPAIYDSIRLHFNLAAMCLTNSSGGPDNLDYVLVEISTDGGMSYYNRMRIRGAVANNSFWPYSATGVAKVYYLPTSEVTFEPAATGLQTTMGYSNCEIVFPGSVTSVAVKITGRSSSSSDTWLIDNVILTGDKSCTNTMASTTEIACDSFVAPSGAIFTTSGIHTDVIPNMGGCDSIITINLTIDSVDLTVTTSGNTATAQQVGGNYQWLDCDNGMAPIPSANGPSFTATTSGNYAAIVVFGSCYDTTECVNLTVTIPPTGIEETTVSRICVTPNPASDVAVLQLTGTARNAKLFISNMHGKQLIKENRLTGSQFDIDISSLPKGIYILEFLSDNTMFTTKFIRE